MDEVTGVFYGMITVSESAKYPGVMIDYGYLAGSPEYVMDDAFKVITYDIKMCEMMDDAQHFDQLCDVLEYVEANSG